MPDIFIELDRDYDMLEEPPPRPPRLGVRRRAWIAAGLAVAILSILGNAEFRPDPGMKLVAEIPTDNTARLMAIEGQLIVIGAGSLISYEPSTGQQRWSVQTGLFEAYAIPKDGLLFVSGSMSRSRMDFEVDQASMAIELSTGEVRWRVPGFVEVVDDLLVAYSSPLYSEMGERTVSIYTREAKLIWTTPAGPVVPALNVERSIMGTVNRDTGELIEYELATGTVTRKYTFPELAGANGLYYDNGRALFYFADGRQLRFDGITVTAMPDEPMFGYPEPMDCGVVWCRHNADSPGYHLVDKNSGKKIFDTDDWEVIVRTPTGLLGARYPQSDGPMPALSVFNPSTGAKLELTGWSALDIVFGGPQLPITDPVYLWSYKNELDYFAVLRGDGPYTVGVLPHTAELRDCAVVAPQLACIIGADLVRIWRLT